MFEVEFLERAAEPGVIFGSKAVGEPPLMLAHLGARSHLRDAIAAFGDAGRGHARQPRHAGAHLLGD